jgi:hypothetical protein
MGRYLSNETLKAFTNSTIVADADAYTAAIAAAEQQIDNACQRRFEVASSASARTFRPIPGSNVLWLDDFTTLTSLVENGTTLTAADFVLEPLNNRTAAGETRPYNRAIRYTGTWYYDGPKPTVTVTAAWGWAAIPPGAIEACKVVAKAFLEGRDIRFGLAGFSEGGGVSEREAKDFVRDYRAPQSWGLA